MKHSDLQRGSPGRLENTRFIEYRTNTKGLREEFIHEGVAFVPDPLPPKSLDRISFVGELTNELLAAQTALVRLDTAVSNLPNQDLLLGAVRRREIQASSVIENTVASGEDLALFEAGKLFAVGEVGEVVNNLRAVEHGRRSSLPICERLIREMHQILMDGVATDRGRNVRAGTYRDTQVYIGDRHSGFEGARFVPPPPGELLLGCIRDYERFVNPGTPQSGDRERYPELIELAFNHYQFECIHPFSDGNGRLGRAIVNLAPRKTGLTKNATASLSEYIERHREEYYNRLLRVSTHGEWLAWTKFFLTALANQATIDHWRVGQLLKLRERLREQFGKTKRSSVKLLELIDHLFDQPWTTAKKAAQSLDLTIPAAQAHISRLVEAKFLKEETGKAHGRIYLASEVIHIVHDPALLGRS